MNFFTGKINMDYELHILSISNSIKLKHLNDGFVSCKDAAYHFKMLIDGLEWCGLLVDCDVFYSHSDGTHSLQRIHW